MSQVNGVMMQYFHWYIDPDLILWKDVNQKAQELADAGITALWLPPAYKGMAGTYDVGYSVYDMYDLGEFEQGHPLTLLCCARASIPPAPHWRPGCRLRANQGNVRR